MIDIEYLNKAILLTQEKKITEAEKIYMDLLTQSPDDSILLSAVGLFYINIGNYKTAANYLKKACELNETIGTVSALGFAEFEQSRYEEAAKILEHALSFGDNEEVYNKLILSLFYIKNFSKAVEYSAKMHEKYPNSPNSISNIVKALTQTGKLLEAESICVNYLKEHTESASLWMHLGFLKELIYSDDTQACECYKMALKNGNQSAYYNIAVSCQKLGDYENAEKNYQKMLEIFPNNSQTEISLGMCYLKQKKFQEGYKLFVKRHHPASDSKTDNLWKGGNLEKEVVIICDQGFGDHIQFIRYIPFLKEKTENITVACHPSLKSLFEKNYPEVKFITYDEINPKTQAIRITDLAYALNIDFDNIPFKESYLNANPPKIDSEKPKIGLCWEAGSAGIRTMINRTINIKLLEPILNLENVQIYSLQVQDTLKGNEKYPQMINLAKDFDNFEATAKAIKAMDAVITVDTSVAHLAGALGVKTFLFLPYSNDWRWFSDAKTTPWYNSVEIFKQDDPISWEKPIGDIVCRLKESFL